MTIYKTKDGDTIDRICWNHYGKTSGAVESVLNANRHLVEYDAVLPVGVIINLPDITPPANKQKIKIWQ